tara:strand:- start:331 stop:489 length:159 start_codon:yes stop_codon:yes gene_type:complete
MYYTDASDDDNYITVEELRLYNNVRSYATDFQVEAHKTDGEVRMYQCWLVGY